MHQHYRPTVSQHTGATVTALPDDTIVSRQPHRIAPEIVSRVGSARCFFSTRRTEAVFNHRSHATTQKDDRRSATISRYADFDAIGTSDSLSRPLEARIR